MATLKETKLHIYVDRCVAGQEFELDEQLDPQFLDLLPTDELVPLAPIAVRGKYYRADEWLIVDASITATIQMPCSMCNEKFSFSLQIPRWVHEQQLSQVEGGVWDMSAALRETILIEIPFFALCGTSACKNRSSIQPYLCQSPTAKVSNEEQYLPFKDLQETLGPEFAIVDETRA